jgi:hypothetical protein
MVERLSGTNARNRMRFDNRYCGVPRFDADTIVAMRACLNAAMVAELFGENLV